MPDKWQALQQFWENFGLPVYDENTVPDEAEMPYITYEASTANFDRPLFLSAQIFYYSPSWKETCNKADEIAKYIGYAGRVKKIDGGYLHIYQGSPFSQKMPDSNNNMVRRMVINISCEFLTAD